MNTESNERPCILLVDDEPEILRILKKILEDDYQVLTAPRAKDALLLMRSDVALVLSDQRMPEMTGSELFRELRQKFPDTVRIIMTGYSDMNALIDSVNQGEIYRYLAKPWEMQNLLNIVQEGVNRYKKNISDRLTHEELHRVRRDLEDVQRELNRLRASQV